MRPQIQIIDGDSPEVQAEIARLGWEVVNPRADSESSDRVFRIVPFGVAVLNNQANITWCNPAFRSWCSGEPIGRPLLNALGNPETHSGDATPVQSLRESPSLSATTTCFRSSEPVRYTQLRMIPSRDGLGQVNEFFVFCLDVTEEILQQQKTDALHQAGLQLSALSPEQLADMSVAERVELLKLNLRRAIHDVLNYDVVEIRLLDRETQRLDLLLADGMTPEAEQRVLYARPQDNGVTGYVAATGRSYVCMDTNDDPHYLEGAEGARSSLTVPLIAHGEVIGTFNIESPRPASFGPEEVQFVELFSREIAQALYTLELLTAQQTCTASQSIAAINRELALPVDEALATATALLGRADHSSELAAGLRQIISAVRTIKQGVQKVSDDLSGGRTSKPVMGTNGRPTGRLKSLRVLVVDSEERVRQSAHAILDRFGCFVETARNGEEALALASHNTYDVVLAAIRLPDISGYDAFRRLKAVQPKGRIVLMTGFDYDGSHSIVKARQEGLRHVLYKPFRVDQLLDVLLANDVTSRPVSAG